LAIYWVKHSPSAHMAGCHYVKCHYADCHDTGGPCHEGVRLLEASFMIVKGML